MSSINNSKDNDDKLDKLVEKIAVERIEKKKKGEEKGYTEQEVFGKNGLNDVPESEDDGWE